MQNIETAANVIRTLSSHPELGYYYFFKSFWKKVETEPLAENWHIKTMCQEAQEVATRVFNRENKEYDLVINVSPGMSKSSIFVKFFIPWCWSQDPTLRFIVGTNSDDLAKDLIERAKTTIDSELYKAAFADTVQIPKGGGGITKITNSAGGKIYIATPKSKRIGIHAHIILVDDPQTREMVYSETERAASNNWLFRTLSTRKVKKSMTPTILVMQRLHEDDATANALKKWKRVRHLRLPATNEYDIFPPEYEEFYTDSSEVGIKVMDPLQMPIEEVRELESTMDALDSSGQLGQDPRPIGGNIIKEDWLSQTFPLGKMLRDAEIENRSIHWCGTLDGAYTQDANNSATAILVYAIIGGQLYLRDYRNWWKEFPDLVTDIPPFVSSAGLGSTGTLFVEPKAIGKSLVQTLRKESKPRINIVEDPIPATGGTANGKLQRVLDSTPFLRGMNVFFSDTVDWGPFIDQCTIFPNGKHTDLVDCLTMAIEKSTNGGDITDSSMWEVLKIDV